ncbi:hypothetical protein F2P56_003060 [Juglans regia]|uniref:Uncharacterized protein n=1 Tax=Juglans regia TaxID=51240 RepID=A0A834DBD7_JUGRE|nr:hypothetical protein F2P56_003060 [Juglans regia]
MKRALKFNEFHYSDEDPNCHLLYSYHSAMEGLAAQLSESEVESLKKFPDVIAIRLEGRCLYWILEFCLANCNRKLVGERFFTKDHQVVSKSSPRYIVQEYISPRDSHGYGTHTSSTAGGASIPMVSVFGNRAGVAQGMAPGTHIATYKVCWFNGCYRSNILAAMDAAIRDGVDILSLSLSLLAASLCRFVRIPLQLAVFQQWSMEFQLFVQQETVAPYQAQLPMKTLGLLPLVQAHFDRRFTAIVRMGNGEAINGESMYPGNRFMTAGRELELVYVIGGNSVVTIWRNCYREIQSSRSSSVFGKRTKFYQPTGFKCSNQT